MNYPQTDKNFYYYHNNLDIHSKYKIQRTNKMQYISMRKRI